jgi:nitrogen fixation/metabolism regulation signal transduction histidine kinase
MFGMLASVPIMMAVCCLFDEPPTLSQIMADTWSMFWPSFLAAVLILPAVLWDLMRMSNRFVGPIYRLRRSMRSLANGADVDPVFLRDGDYWFDFAEDFNRVATEMGAIKPADLVNRDASDELDTEDAPSEEELVEA